MLGSEEGFSFLDMKVFLAQYRHGMGNFILGALKERYLCMNFPHFISITTPLFSAFFVSAEGEFFFLSNSIHRLVLKLF